MKKVYLFMLSVMMTVGCFGQSSVVYFTKDITPESLVSIYEALGAYVSSMLHDLFLLIGSVAVTDNGDG